MKNVIVEKDENLFYYIELIDLIGPKPKKIYNTFQDIFEFYAEKKTEGNEYFAKGNFEVAIKKYERALNAYQCVISN
jgi:tetratricopeptide (TPR) repeat protein